jgi:hypothetical protein
LNGQTNDEERKNIKTNKENKKTGMGAEIYAGILLGGRE